MKPCPFCQTKDSKIDWAVRGGRYVVCNYCASRGAIEDDEKSALSAWNARVPAQSAGGGEPVAWRWKFKHEKGNWVYCSEYNFAEEWVDKLIIEPLYARAIITDTAQEGVAIRPLEWSKTFQPDQSCRYHHVIADSIFGQLRIEWKGWKDSREPYVVHMDDDYMLVADTLEDAKAETFKLIETRIRSAIALPAAPSNVDTK